MRQWLYLPQPNSIIIRQPWNKKDRFPTSNVLSISKGNQFHWLSNIFRMKMVNGSYVLKKCWRNSCKTHNSSIKIWLSDSKQVSKITLLPTIQFNSIQQINIILFPLNTLNTLKQNFKWIPEELGVISAVSIFLLTTLSFKIKNITKTINEKTMNDSCWKLCIYELTKSTCRKTNPSRERVEVDKWRRIESRSFFRLPAWSSIGIGGGDRDDMTMIGVFFFSGEA